MIGRKRLEGKEDGEEDRRMREVRLKGETVSMLRLGEGGESVKKERMMNGEDKDQGETANGADLHVVVAKKERGDEMIEEMRDGMIEEMTDEMIDEMTE